jgi:hypothetical protein
LRLQAELEVIDLLGRTVCARLDACARAVDRHAVEVEAARFEAVRIGHIEQWTSGEKSYESGDVARHVPGAISFVA